MAIESRFLASSGREIFTGNELLVKGVLETEGGVHMCTGYPGSPIAGFFDGLEDLSALLNEKGVRAFQANNEALAAAAVNGSQMLPCRTVMAMKSVGVHVAADALHLANLAGAHPQGGAVIIMGEDPWCESTQVPADSRFICEHLRMPTVEPGGPQDVKDWIGLSFKLSQAAGLYIGYIITCTQADGGGTVTVSPNQFPQLNTQQRLTLETTQINLDRVLLPPRTWQHELAIPERFAKTMQAARELGVNQIIPATGNWQLTTDNSPLGFITTGMGHVYLQHLLSDLGLSGAFPILRMGMSYPADVQLVAEFSKLCKNMVVIEERRSFLERNIRDRLFHELPQEQAAEIAGRLFGKNFPARDGKVLPGIPEGRGLNRSLLGQILIPLIQATEELPAAMRNGPLTAELELSRQVSQPKLKVLDDRLALRTPTFCPGCPHRDSAAALLEMRENLRDPSYMLRQHGTGPVDLVAHGDTGCYSMLMFAPTEQLMHNYSGMGLGAGTGSGIDSFITNKQITFMGDGTFFHSGAMAISNAIHASQDITFIILANGTTAMTGHQEHAGNDRDLLGHEHPAQDIEQVVRGLGGTGPLTVVRLSPAERPTYRSVLEKTILSDGVKVIIADKECGITHRRAELREERRITRQKGYLPRQTHMNITPEVCELCLECTRQTACPGLTLAETDYGRKIDTDLTWCVNDGACERVRVNNSIATGIKPCPAFEYVTIVRKRRRRYTLPNMSLDKLPEPHRVARLDKLGESWRVHMAGVGGMGIGVVTAILVRAGHKDGYRVVFSDRKGLAIRNGGVFSQITFIKEPPDVGAASADRLPSSVPDADNRSAKAAPTGTMPSASIPFGRADLILGIDILEAARAVDPREAFRVASPQRTAAILNMYKQPTVYTLLGRHDFDPEPLREMIYEQCRGDFSFAKNLSEICERRLGSKQYVNIMMLGVAFQLGLVPVSAHAIAWAIKDSIRREFQKNLKAFNIGRKLALEPRVLPNRPQPETWEQLVQNKTRILRRTRLRGRTWAGRYEQLVQWSMKQMRDIPEEAKYDLALRLYDLLQYQNHRLARRYAEMVRQVYRRDSAERAWAATVAVIVNLAKVMLIKDEPYVAYLLTRYEKKHHDMAKFGIDRSNGERLVYQHLTSPEFNIGRLRIRLRLRTRDWQLRLVRHCTWWRRLPGWHKKEVAFRDWYLSLLDRISLSGDAAYQQALAALRCPQEVNGYREIRYPKMDAARDKAEAELARLATAPADAAGSIMDAVRRTSQA